MKRFILCAFALLTVVFTYAQDIIVTTSSQKIEAKIIEVSKSQIKYKEADNIDGPLFVIETSEINSIIYSNGKVVLYNQTSQQEEKQVSQAVAQPTSQVSEQQGTGMGATILLRSGYTLVGELVEMNNQYVAYLDNGERKTVPASQIQNVTLSNGQIKDYSNSATAEKQKTVEEKKTSSRIYRENGDYLHNDVYISAKEVELILKRENATAYKQWKKADGMMIGGAVCTGIGGGMVIGGLFTLINKQYLACVGIECASLVPLGIGLGLTLGASSQYNKAIDIYNSKFDHAAVQLRWSVSPTGVGIAFAF